MCSSDLLFTAFGDQVAGCVDNAQLVERIQDYRLHEIARNKLEPDSNIREAHSDLLEFIDGCVEKFDLIVSTYAVHHLTLRVRQHLFLQSYAFLVSGGRAIFGDLMFESDAERKTILDA